MSADGDVGGEDKYAAPGDGPGVEIVDSDDAVHFLDVTASLVEVDSAGCRF
jgi:hypothetical protein